MLTFCLPVGTNPEDFYDLGAEVELTLGGEKQTITRSCIVFIPKGWNTAR